MCSLLVAAGRALSIFAPVEDHTLENIWTALTGLDLCFVYVRTQRWVREEGAMGFGRVGRWLWSKFSKN